ncbi:diguanylate cyclase (GGDEF)-like protein [Lacibacter cauensis]|uniref:diguanylate cyclase n=1 Tax=Lacibacter cauensis TaxID=510947 RepID=A0A562SCC7_9BACT|nr:GGDEF domain-containing protein [Lacibacter cauensis]TWI79025.1 diguanylate cyclase (GGDEF)-like protein [Lacibacter cauensis]
MGKQKGNFLGKFKEDAISNGVYDLFKWVLSFLILLIPTNWIPGLKDLLSTKYLLSVYWLIIASLMFIIVTALIVGLVFKRKLVKVQMDNYTDELTGLKNHKALKDFLDQKIEEYKRKDESLSIIILDIDDFKAFNTKFGFSTADQILKKVGEMLGNDKRATDETFRYFNRGDEFLVVASDTNLSQATQAAERKRKLVEKAVFSVDDSNHQLTVSCGVTAYKKEDDLKSFTDRVIEALNVAKKAEGKNCTKPIV